MISAPTASERRPTMYGTTEKKITHIIDESRGRGWDGFVCTVCGKWMRPDWLTRDKPEGTRMCKLCKLYTKKEADHEVSEP